MLIWGKLLPDWQGSTVSFWHTAECLKKNGMWCLRICSHKIMRLFKLLVHYSCITYCSSARQWFQIYDPFNTLSAISYRHSYIDSSTASHFFIVLSICSYWGTSSLTGANDGAVCMRAIFYPGQTACTSVRLENTPAWDNLLNPFLLVTFCII